MNYRINISFSDGKNEKHPFQYYFNASFEWERLSFKVHCSNICRIDYPYRTDMFSLKEEGHAYVYKV